MSATAQNSVQCSRVFRRNLLQLRVEQLLERLEVVVPPEVEAALHEVYAELQAAKWPVDDCSRPKGAKVVTPESTESTAELAAAHVGGIDDHDHDHEVDVDQSRGVQFFNGKLKKSYRFVAPEKIEVVGSMLLKTLTKKTIDLAVYLPEAMWENKDHVNYRYADKRAAYASVLYKNLERAKNHGKRSFNVTIDPVEGNATRPAITVHLEATAWKVRILPCMASSDEPGNQAPRGTSTGAVPGGTQQHFQEMKLQLWKNCLRRRGSTTEKQSEGQDTDRASPYYNAALLEELYMKRILLLQHQCLEHQPALRPAIILLKRWLSVRFFENMGLECPMGVLACYVAMGGAAMHAKNGNGLGSLSAGKTKMAMRGPVQVFKATLSWIAQQYDQAARSKSSSAAVPVEKHHFAGSGGCLQQIIKNAVKSTSTTAPATSPTMIHPASSTTTSHIDAALEAGMRSVAVEPLNLFVGELNIFHKFPKPVLADVAFEARLTLKVLDADRDQFAFEQVFAVQQRPEFHWDSLVVIDVGGKSAAAVSAPQYGFASRWAEAQDHRVLGHDDTGHLPRKKHQSDELFANVDGEADLHDSEAPWAVLAVERAVAILERGLGPRLLRSCVRVLPEKQLALIGLKLSTPRVEKTVLRGPSADDVEAVEAWKKLWRENVEVRRFRDGKIQQCTVFAAVEGGVPPLALQITDHLMKQHFPEDATRLELGPQAITLPPHEPHIWTDFEQLRDLLMDAELPLAVSRVAASSRGFSYCNYSCGADDENDESSLVEKVILNNSEKTVEEAVVELEWSSLWPRDCEQAIGVFEGSFLNEVRKQLAEMAGVNAHLGDETWSLLCSTTSGLSAGTCESAALATSKVPRPFLDVVYPTRVFRLRIFYAYKPSVAQNAQFLTFGSHVKGKDIAAVLKALENEPQDADAGIAAAADGADAGADAGEDTRSPAASSPDGRDSLSELRDNWWKPRVRQAFHTLTLQQPNFPLCLQLVNKWLSAKWFLRGFEDFYEHLVALLFSKVTTVFCGLPTTANAGFARFLWLVANALSGESPLVLEDFGYAPPEIQGAETGLQLGFTQIQSGDNKHEQQQMSEEQLHLLQNSFERRRGSNRKHVVALCSRYDPHGVFVTTPSFSMLSKLREHAAAALKLLQTTNDVGWLHDHQVQTAGAPRPPAHAGAVDVKSRCSSAETVRPSFPPPRACFDALFTKPEFDLEIHLDPRSGSKSGILKHPHFSDVYELMVRDTRELLFQRLQAKYGSWAVLYRNRGNAIGFEWRPEAFSSGVQGGDLDAENAGGEHGGAGRVDHDITTRGTSTQSAQNNVNGKKRRRVDESGVEGRENKKERSAGSASFSSIKRLMARGCSYAATSVADEESVLPDTDLLLQDVRSWVHKSIPFRVVQN
eukprot:g10802.t1